MISQLLNALLAYSLNPETAYAIGRDWLRGKGHTALGVERWLVTKLMNRMTDWHSGEIQIAIPYYEIELLFCAIQLLEHGTMLSYEDLEKLSEPDLDARTTLKFAERVHARIPEISTRPPLEVRLEALLRLLRFTQVDLWNTPSEDFISSVRPAVIVYPDAAPSELLADELLKSLTLGDFSVRKERPDDHIPRSIVVRHELFDKVILAVLDDLCSVKKELPQPPADGWQ